MSIDKKETKNQTSSRIRMVVVLCLTLGLAPFFPEPHILGKLRWVMGGAYGMTTMDYFDLGLHGLPWVFLIFLMGKWVVESVKTQGS